MTEYHSALKAAKRLIILQKLYIKTHMKSCLLHWGQYPILEYVTQHPGCTQVEIAEYLHVTPASIACSAKRMCNAGLIERRTDNTDLRCNHLTPTATGIALAKEARQIHARLERRMFGGFSAAEITKFTSLLNRMNQNIAGEYENDSLAQLVYKLTEMEDLDR